MNGEKGAIKRVLRGRPTRKERRCSIARGFSQWEISRLEPIEGQWPGEISTHSAAGPLTGQCVVALHTAGINIEVLVRQDSWYFRQRDRPYLHRRRYPSSFFLLLDSLHSHSRDDSRSPTSANRQRIRNERKRERGRDPGPELSDRERVHKYPRVACQSNCAHCTRGARRIRVRVFRGVWRAPDLEPHSWWFVTRRPGESATLTGLCFNTHEAHTYCCNSKMSYTKILQKKRNNSRIVLVTSTW